ncbi:hypothetical protein DFJ77DRAFT_447668 [Powellomyces hirtus]|nr:hypothetical protein DFJ77DRAFT_447668 [Powellomyces hirtus]
MSTKADKAESAESKPEKMDVDESATPTDNAKEDAVELTSPEKRKRGRKPKDTTDAQDENDAGQAADENAKEEKGTPKTKKAKKDADVETPGSEARARRERKPTQHYTVEATVKTPKAIEIPEGKGTPLKDIKTIADNIASTPASDDLITGFHTLVWGRAGHKHIKQDILKFKGFNFQSDKEHDLALNKLARWTTAGLKEFAQLLHLESSGTKEVIIDRVFKFLQEPSAAGTKSGGTPRKSKSGSKTPTKSPKASKASISEATPKKRGPKPKPKSVFELYAQEQRAEAVEELDEDASENDIQAKLKELFEELDEADLKQYEEKFDALKTVKTSKAPAKTPSKTKATKPAKTPKNGVSNGISTVNGFGKT